MSTNRTLEHLRRAGFTAYESEAYLALLAKRELTAEEISRATSIPITRVYGTLEQLMQKGFARIAQGRPKKFHAVPPDQAKREYLKNLRQTFETNLVTVDDTLRNLQTLVEPIYVESHLQVKAEELLEPLEDLKVMERRTSSYLQEASEEVLISTALFSWLPKVKDQLRGAVKRGVNVRILMQISDSPMKKQLEDLFSFGVQIRETPDPWHPVRGTMVDNKALIFVIWAAEEVKRHWNPIVYTPNHTKNPGLIRLFRESFFHRWAKASQPLEKLSAK
ncbi:MAG TPA: helix-turn-helix domain-containing protein [Terriglobales bacterium]|nr:helix-turn-helix domain-containing protein [Terriglobales bacterium]